MRAGETWILSVPPGWLIAATISGLDEDYLILRDASYIESVASDSIWGIALAKTPAAAKKIAGTCYPIPDGTVVRREAVLIAAPAACSLRVLARAAESDAIQKAR